MEYFQKFHSNTLAGSGNQSFFLTDDANTVYTGRVFYKIFAGGTYRYSFLFSNIIDSTFSDGAYSHKNLICDQWKSVRAAVGICETCSASEMGEIESFQALTFSGAFEKDVMPGEFFASDALELSGKKGDYICLEISYQGRMIPYHEESIIPTFALRDGEWVPSKRVVFAGMVGCDRPALLQIGYLGDSITQGIGTDVNSYDHWNAMLSDKLGEKCAYWNLGLGFGRASDAASDGAWLFKAKQMDVVVVCYGVNDLFQSGDEEQIKRDLSEIVSKLQSAGTKVVIQTIPPFDYSGILIEKWNHINQYIVQVLSKRADGVFDVVPVLAKDDGHPYLAKFGGHPNAEGCGAWAEALYPVMDKFLATISC